jgi:hypothetical protein
MFCSETQRKTREMYIDTQTLSLAIHSWESTKARKHELYETWVKVFGKRFAREKQWVFLTLYHNSTVIMCPYEYHKTVFDLLATQVLDNASLLDEHIRFLCNSALIFIPPDLAHAARNTQNVLKTATVTVKDDNEQTVWDMSQFHSVANDGQLTHKLTDELCMVQTAMRHDRDGDICDVFVRNPGRWLKHLPKSANVQSAIVVNDCWFDLQWTTNYRLPSIFVAVHHSLALVSCREILSNG